MLVAEIYDSPIWAGWSKYRLLGSVDRKKPPFLPLKKHVAFFTIAKLHPNKPQGAWNSILHADVTDDEFVWLRPLGSRAQRKRSRVSVNLSPVAEKDAAPEVGPFPASVPIVSLIGVMSVFGSSGGQIRSHKKKKKRRSWLNKYSSSENGELNPNPSIFWMASRTRCCLMAASCSFSEYALNMKHIRMIQLLSSRSASHAND